MIRASETLLAEMMQDRALEMFFEGFKQHFAHAVASGRGDTWLRAIEQCGKLMIQTYAPTTSGEGE